MLFKLIVADTSVFKFFTEYMNTFLEHISKPLSDIGSLDITKCHEFIAMQRGTWIPDYIYLTVKNISVVNTEQLCDIEVEKRVVHELEQVKCKLQDSSYFTVYDYSQTNIDILSKYGFICKRHEYISPSSEIIQLTSLLQVKKEYDIGFVGAINPRRKLILDELMKHCKVCLIDTFGLDRDTKIGKCTYLLNIHWDTHFTIFETIRCNRWLSAGHTVISENSIDTPSFTNLELVSYESIVSCIVNKLQSKEK